MKAVAAGKDAAAAEPGWLRRFETVHQAVGTFEWARIR